MAHFLSVPWGLSDEEINGKMRRDPKTDEGIQVLEVHLNDLLSGRTLVKMF